MIRWATIILSICGLAVGVWAVASSDQVPPTLALSRQPSVNPFGRGISALGFVEPANRVAQITAPEAGLVTSVLVEVGDVVEIGQPLMTLDTRRLESELIKAKAAVPPAQAEVDRWHALPRLEDLPALEALVSAADAEVAERELQLQINEEARARGAATDRDVAQRRLSAAAAKSLADKALADLARLKAGGWQPDLTLSEAILKQRQADVASLELLIERQTVRATRAGTVLRRDIEPGEFVTTENSRAALSLGDLSRLRVRAQIDEEDIALLTGSGASLKAIARTRGAVVVEFPLSFHMIEPFARPKTDLSGENTERVDTRIVDVVLDVSLKDSQGTRLYPGQAVDVFIDTGS